MRTLPPPLPYGRSDSLPRFPLGIEQREKQTTRKKQTELTAEYSHPSLTLQSGALSLRRRNSTVESTQLFVYLRILFE